MANLTTIAAAAESLGLKESTIRDIIRAGTLPHYRFGVGRGTIRIDPADLEVYRQRCLVGTPEPQAHGLSCRGSLRLRRESVDGGL